MKKRYLGYIRVSTAKQGQYGSSLQEQRDAIELFAKRFDFDIAEWFEDRETAAKKGRTQFLRMMSALEKGKAGGVILHKIDRGARNLWDWARLQDLIDAGLEVHFAHDNLDLKSRGGRLAADIQAVVAADYVRNLRDEVRKGIRGRLKQGFYPFKAPVGYLDCGKAKPKEIDPIKGPLVRDAFNLYATKQFSYHTLRVELRRRGLCKPNGKPLSMDAITGILRNPFYVGIIQIQRTGETFQGVHQPLIATRTFRLVQEIIDGRENGRTGRHDFVYRRLIACGSCGFTLTGERQKGHVYYRCHTRDCPTTGIREEAVTVVFREVSDSLPCSSADYAEMMPYVEREERFAQERRTEMVASLRLRIAAIQERERRLTDAYLDSALEKDSYDSRKATLLIELAQTRDDLQIAEAGRCGVVERTKRFFELLETFELGPSLGSPQEFGEVAKIFTSNRLLVGKKLSIELRSPFKEMVSDPQSQISGPSRNVLRTSEQRFHDLGERLEGWEPSGRPPRPNVEPVRKQNPSWFKSEHAKPANDDER